MSTFMLKIMRALPAYNLSREKWGLHIADFYHEV